MLQGALGREQKPHASCLLHFFVKYRRETQAKPRSLRGARPRGRGAHPGPCLSLPSCRRAAPGGRSGWETLSLALVRV